MPNVTTSSTGRERVIDEAFIDGWVERLRRDVPGAVAIVL